MMRTITRNLACWLMAALLVVAALPAQAQNDHRVLMQGFNWESQRFNWYDIVEANAADMNAAGIDMVWLPPSSDAADNHGYLPRELYDLNSNYGSEQDLRDLIATLHANDIEVIADIVINHRVGSTGWADFQNPTWGCWSIIANDEWGQNGGNPCGNWDSGDNYHAARDLDHSNPTVQADLIAWMNWLKNDVGFDGWRYDYIRGYWGGYNKIYNDGTSPTFSVGELWKNLNPYDPDPHRQDIVDWIDETQGASSAFDFTTKGVLQQALNDNNLSMLNRGGGAPGVIGWWPAKAVTFIDNHDTGSTQNYWPFPGNKVMQGYAYILTHPGVPTVFWDHFYDWGLKQPITDLIQARKAAGVHSTSSLNIVASSWNLYAAVIDGDNGQVAMKIGSGSWSPSGGGWTLATSGNDYAVWTRINSGLTVHFRPQGYSNPEIYFWNVPGASTSWPGEQMTPEGNGWYYYTLPSNCANFIFSNNGAGQTADLYSCQEAWYDDRYYSAGESLQTEFEGAAAKLSVFPNPARGAVTIAYEGEGTLTVYDMSGRTVHASAFEGKAKIGAGLERGVYLVRLVTEGQTLTQRFVKE